MTKVDFYVLQSAEQQAQFHFACRLIEKAYKLGHRIFVACNNTEDAEAINTLLWSFNPESFLPHSLLKDQQSTSIEIGELEHCGDHHQLLINLGDALPEYFSRFERVCEIAVQNDATLKQTRQKWTFLKQRGYPVASHSI